MLWESALTVTAEVGIGIAGFSGLFAAVARRSPENWGATEQVSLEILLLASGSAIFASLLPFLLLESGIRDSSSWAISSAVYGSWLGGILVMRARQRLRLDTGPLKGEALARYVFGIAVVVLHATNLVFVQSPWPYMVGIYFQLLVSFLAFSRLLRGAVDPHAA
jgi:uncharacterized membrane protein